MFQCFECSKVFTQKGTLNRHVTSIHQEGIFVCHNCGEKFNRNFALKRHMDNCGQSYPCDVCDEKYETSSKLKIHKLSHYKNQLACTNCHKIFKHETNLKKHQLTCNIQCDICFTSFSNPSNLKIIKQMYMETK